MSSDASAEVAGSERHACAKRAYVWSAAGTAIVVATVALALYDISNANRPHELHYMPLCGALFSFQGIAGFLALRALLSVLRGEGSLGWSHAIPLMVSWAYALLAGPLALYGLLLLSDVYA